MFHTTKGIVLNKTQHTDNSLILRVLTREFGVLSFYVRISKKSKNKRNSLYQYFSFLEMEIKMKNNSKIHSLKEIRPYKLLINLYSDVLKSSLLLFMCEIINKSMEEDYHNEELFDWLEHAVEVLDELDQIKNFPIWFLIDLSRFYGFIPSTNYSVHTPCFDLSTGEFVAESSANHIIRDKEINHALDQILGMIFDDFVTFNMKPEVRSGVLELLINYFQLQIEGMGEIKSHKVLKEVFQ